MSYAEQMKGVKRRKTSTDPYYGYNTYTVSIGGLDVATVSQEGQPGRDDYPWGWMLLGPAPARWRGRTTGTEESLKVAVAEIAAKWWAAHQPEELA